MAKKEKWTEAELINNRLQFETKGGSTISVKITDFSISANEKQTRVTFKLKEKYLEKMISL